MYIHYNYMSIVNKYNTCGIIFFFNVIILVLSKLLFSSILHVKYNILLLLDKTNINYIVTRSGYFICILNILKIF